MIYLDNNATTPLAPEVIEAMQPWVSGEKFGNPSSGYRAGREARKAVDLAREQVASLIGADPSEVIFTSGGTESINTAIHSAIQAHPLGGKHLVTTTAEHSAVENPMLVLEEAGYEVSRASVDREGQLDVDDLAALIRPDETALVSVILANNETGVISPIEDIAEICRERGVLWHADAVQAVGKIPVQKLAPLMSLSAHKFHGPKGIGALVVDQNIRFRSLMQGGGQESDRRSGTENVGAIVGMGAAAVLAGERLEERGKRLAELRDRFESGVLAQVAGSEVNGTTEIRLPNTSNLYFPGVDGEGLLILLDQMDVACSPGSACGSGAVKPSRVIKAMGFSSERARSSVRFSVSEMNTDIEIDEAILAVKMAVGKLKVVMPSNGPRVVMR